MPRSAGWSGRGRAGAAPVAPIVEGQKIDLQPGDSWLVPAGAEHRYNVIEPFTAIEATAPPAQVHGRDTPPGAG